MPVVRDENHKNYLYINKKVLLDARLSMGARGAWACAVSFPENTEININLCSRNDKESDMDINAYFEELVEFGYAEKIIKGGSDCIICNSCYLIKNHF